MPKINELLSDIMKLSNTELLTDFKIETDKEETIVSSTNDLGTFVLNAKMNDVYADIEGTIGMNQVSFLRGLLNMKVFKDDNANITVTHKERNGNRYPDEIHFVNEDAKASYRLMFPASIKPMVWFIEQEWDVEFTPSKDMINSFAQLASLTDTSETRIKIVDDDLVAYLGDEHGSTHKAQLNLASGVEGTDFVPLNWPIKEILYAMRLCNDTSVIRFKNGNIMNVELKTDLGTYNFYIYPLQ